MFHEIIRKLKTYKIQIFLKYKHTRKKKSFKRKEKKAATPDFSFFHLTGVNSIFSKMECDRSVIEDLLGSSTGISENNIMSYLGLVEQKTNELLTVQAFLNSKVTC